MIAVIFLFFDCTYEVQLSTLEEAIEINLKGRMSEEKFKQFKESLNGLEKTMSSAKELLEFNNRLIKDSDLGNSNELAVVQKNFLLDSFKASKVHSDYKRWQSEKKDAFIRDDVRSYNEKLAIMARLNYDIEKLDEDKERLRKKVLFPDFSFSLSTLKKYEDGYFLKYLKTDDNGNYPSLVDIKDIFTLNDNKDIPQLEYHVFKKLLNIEYRHRVEAKLKYELLLSVKQQLTMKNKRWSTRDSELDYFMNKTLASVISDAQNIRKNEYDDLKDFDEYENSDLDADEEMFDQEAAENELDDIDSKTHPLDDGETGGDAEASDNQAANLDDENIVDKESTKNVDTTGQEDDKKDEDNISDARSSKTPEHIGSMAGFNDTNNKEALENMDNQAAGGNSNNADLAEENSMHVD